MSRTERRARAATPVDDQIRVSRLESTPGLHVAATFRTPLPWSIHQDNRATSNGRYHLPDVESITVYLELDDGYPITSTGHPGSDFLRTIEAALQEPQVATHLPGGATSIVVAERLVVLGFSMTLESFLPIESALRIRFDLLAELAGSESDPPIAPERRLTRAQVDEYRRAYATEAVGRP